MTEPTAPSPVRPSACPGLLRIAQALDGGICRVKLPGGVLPAARARALAQAARRYASGILEATNRSNVQVRGVGARAADLQQALLAAGFGARQPGGDDVRNLMLSPMAGLDPAQCFDARPLAERLLAALEGEPRYHQLSPKFALQLHAGEALACLDHPHDLWLAPLQQAGEVTLGLGLASSLNGGKISVALPLAQAEDAVRAVLERFLELATPQESRLRQVLARVGEGALLAPLLAAGWQTDHGGFELAPPVRDVGVHPQRQQGKVAVAARFVLGRFDASQLLELAGIAAAFGNAELRFTPWQGVLLPGVAAGHAGAVQRALHEAGLLVDGRQPLAGLVACTGSSGCAKAHADTKADARHLARLLWPARAVHVSGCTRSCATAQAAPFTLLAVAPGRYDLFIRDGAQPGLGRLRARELTLQAAANVLNGLPRSDT